MDKTQQISSGFGQNRKRFLKYIAENILVFCNLAAVFLGVISGLILKSFDLSEEEQYYMAVPGDLVMRMLQLVMVPLIVTRLILGVAGLGFNKYRKIALHAGVYFIFTTLVSVKWKPFL